MEHNREGHIGKQDAINQYLKTISHHLCCTDKKKKEIVKELESDIRIAMENGETWEDIKDRMGSPEEIAEEFNENFSEKELQADKRKKALGIVGIVVLMACVVVAAVILIPGKSSNPDKNNSKQEASNSKQEASNSKQTEKDADASQQDEIFSTENIKNYTDYDEAAVIEQTKTIISLVDAGDCETLQNEYTADIMKSMMVQSKMDEAKQMICDDWGSFQSYGNFYTSGVEQAGEKYVVVQVNVSYENANVTFTISLDNEMKMVGIYMK